jgi:coatomer subunit beta'
VLEYQTAVMRGDFDTADKVLPMIPRDQRTRVANFLEKQGFPKQALAVSQDAEHKFELALKLGELQQAYALAKEADSEEKWRLLSTAAAARSDLLLAGECLRRAKDYGGLLLLATSAGSAPLMSQLAGEARTSGSNNVAFAANMLQGNVDECVQVRWFLLFDFFSHFAFQILIDTGRLPEAAMYARTYCPSQVERVLALWQARVADGAHTATGGNSSATSTQSAKLAAALASPAAYPNLFPGFEEHARAERYTRMLARQSIPAGDYPHLPPTAQRDVLQVV